MRIVSLLPLFLLAACTSSPDRLDGSPTFESIPLQHVAAQEVVAVLQAQLDAGSEAVADSRTNSVIVRGSPADVIALRELVARLDQPVE